MGTSGHHIYLDHSATTPADLRVVEAMAPYWSERFGNSESSHAFGRAAAGALEQARQTVADVLGCRPSEIVFTGSGTEADNLALRGVAWAARQSGRGNHIVTTSIEHHAVGHTVDQLRDLFGFEVTRVSVDEHGSVNLDEVADAIRPATILVSVMMANNEVGTVQPMVRIGRMCRERGVVFHSDAVQAAGRLPLELDDLNVDLLALSAHKFYGPKGVGLLYVRRGTPFIPTITGGDHERGRRPGTANVAGAIGLATALRLVEEIRVAETVRLRRLRDGLIEGILERIPDSRLTGHPVHRLAHHASFAFRGVEGESIVLSLDLEGVAASSGAACAEGEPEPSFVLAAMGLSPDWGIGSLRLTLGHSNDEADVARVLEVLPGVIEGLRASG
ncbi:MAG: aminotransferase class V-fold PLP-dependent enzyme [Anaerolineae bacterium]|nr:aminotransferase class V-fold PLP-dependent enzyme [Anaerolineae bacterium]